MKNQILISNTTECYIQEINKYPLLSLKEEQFLTDRFFKTQNADDAKKLVMANLRFVVKIAMEYSKYQHKILDLIQEGNLGLMYAIKHFDPNKKVKLISYAVYWVRAYIVDFIVKNYSIVGGIKEQKDWINKIKQEREYLQSKGIKVTDSLLATVLNKKESFITNLNARMLPDVSLEKKIRNDSDVTIKDTLMYKRPSIESVLCNEEQYTLFLFYLNSFKNTLEDSKEKAIMEQRLLSENPRTLKDIGIDFGVTREAMRQKEAKIIQNLRKYFLKELNRGCF